MAAESPGAAPGPATAATAASVAPSLPQGLHDVESPGASLVSTVLTVALIGAAVAWALKRGPLQKLRAAAPGGSLLQVRETVHVAPKVRVTCLRCGGHEVLLAHGEHSLAWLALPGAQATTPEERPHEAAGAPISR